MKKFFYILIILFCNTLLCYSETLQGEVSFDWIKKSQMDRDESIIEIRDEIFTPNIVLHYGERFFKTMYKNQLKDNDYKKTYNDILQGRTENSEKKLCGFYWKTYLVAYGVQYKDRMEENFYYDGFGKLKWVDRYSSTYPNFPYSSFQYDTKGDLKAVYYFISDDIQYVYNAEGKFMGLWDKDKMYDKNAKVIMSRTNWK
jgi:hypothetical protein